MEPRPLSSQSVPCLTKLRLIFSMGYNGKHMHSQEQREEICGTLHNSPIWHTALLLGTAFSGTVAPVVFSLFIHLYILEG